jgi:hypothetical protein
MEPEGMVHALELGWQLLDQGGVLIDIHPIGEPPPIEFHIGNNCWSLGLVQESDDCIEYFQADQAIVESLQNGFFAMEKQSTFEHVIKANTIAELQDYLQDHWQDAILPPEIEKRTHELLETLDPLALSSEEEKSIQIRETIKITRLVKKSPKIG